MSHVEQRFDNCLLINRVKIANHVDLDIDSKARLLCEKDAIDFLTEIEQFIQKYKERPIWEDFKIMENKIDEIYKKYYYKELGQSMDSYREMKDNQPQPINIYLRKTIPDWYYIDGRIMIGDELVCLWNEDNKEYEPDHYKPRSRSKLESNLSDCTIVNFVSIVIPNDDPNDRDFIKKEYYILCDRNNNDFLAEINYFKEHNHNVNADLDFFNESKEILEDIIDKYKKHAVKIKTLHIDSLIDYVPRFDEMFLINIEGIDPDLRYKWTF